MATSFLANHSDHELDLQVCPSPPQTRTISGWTSHRAAIRTVALRVGSWVLALFFLWDSTCGPEFSRHLGSNQLPWNTFLCFPKEVPLWSCGTTRNAGWTQSAFSRRNPRGPWKLLLDYWKHWTKLMEISRLDFVFPRIVPMDGRRHRSFPSIQSHAKGLRYHDSIISPLWGGG